ncbi:MAG: 30S ribosomal protein S27e [Candidatus Hadarchaeales archaeon]
MPKGEPKFVIIRCPDCGNEQQIYIRASTHVKCQVCGKTLAVPTGGRAELKGTVVRTLDM